MLNYIKWTLAILKDLTALALAFHHAPVSLVATLPAPPHTCRHAGYSSIGVSPLQTDHKYSSAVTDYCNVYVDSYN